MNTQNVFLVFEKRVERSVGKSTVLDIVLVPTTSVPLRNRIFQLISKIKLNFYTLNIQFGSKSSSLKCLSSSLSVAVEVLIMVFLSPFLGV